MLKRRLGRHQRRRMAAALHGRAPQASWEGHSRPLATPRQLWGNTRSSFGGASRAEQKYKCPRNGPHLPTPVNARSSVVRKLSEADLASHFASVRLGHTRERPARGPRPAFVLRRNSTAACPKDVVCADRKRLAIARRQRDLAGSARGDEQVAGQARVDTCLLLARVFAAEGAGVAAYVRFRQRPPERRWTTPSLLCSTTRPYR
jgi:hypothetical protein